MDPPAQPAGWFMATVSNTTQIEITKQPSYDIVYLI